MCRNPIRSQRWLSRVRSTDSRAEPADAEHVNVTLEAAAIYPPDMSAIVVSSSAWPLVVVHFPPKWERADWDASIEEVRALLARGERFALISNTIGSQTPNASERRRTADFFEANEAALRATVAGWAIATDSVLARGAITAITWLRAPPFPSATFATMAQAEAWCRAQL
jgi:hypothetical protein